jgi:hypothetical protein
MVSATHDDVSRLFPGIQDHTVLEILATEATVSDLEAALLLLEDNDEGLIDAKQQKGSLLNHLLAIIAKSEIRPRDDVDR